MDLHNNDIGRSYRYLRFRDHWLWDRWDWNNWGLRIRDYIDNEAENGTYIPEWNGVTISTEEAWAREASVPNVRYIYFAQCTSRLFPEMDRLGSGGDINGWSRYAYPIPKLGELDGNLIVLSVTEPLAEHVESVQLTANG